MAVWCLCHSALCALRLVANALAASASEQLAPVVLDKYVLMVFVVIFLVFFLLFFLKWP